jgi:hypothetical protein
VGEGVGGGDPPSYGFYRVVRQGIHLFGITNGMVLSGQVPLLVEFGHADANRTLSQVFLSNNDSDDDLPGSSFPSSPSETAAPPNGVWDTTQVTNGVYVLQLGALLDDGSVALDAPATATVSNVIWFPDPWNVGGLAFYIGIQTIYTNGTWHLDGYDDQNTYLGWLEGYIDTNGYCNYPGVPGPGFSMDNTDGSGNQNPSAFYTLVMAVLPTGRPPPYPAVTNKVFIEPPWNVYTRAVVCYQPVFPDWMPGAEQLLGMMEIVWGAEETYHWNLLGTSAWPYQIQDMGGWSTVTNNLADFVCRDLCYFGHATNDMLGSGSATLRLAEVQKLLDNNLKDPLTATNMHPFRFVFIDGCNAADGDWPQAFGIPKKKGMVVNDFYQKRGVRPRAFMGWNRKKVVGTKILQGGQMYQPHIDYINKFWDWWCNGTTGLRPVKQAIREAELRAPLAADGMVLYGAEDLVVNY